MSRLGLRSWCTVSARIWGNTQRVASVVPGIRSSVQQMGAGRGLASVAECTMQHAVARTSSTTSGWGTTDTRTTVGIVSRHSFHTSSEVKAEVEVPVMSMQQLEQLLKENKGDYVLLDVREYDETASGMIFSAHNVPLSVLEEAMGMDDEKFATVFGFAKPSADQRIITYCRSGMRSEAAGSILKGLGFDHISNYEGSWMEWVDYEHPDLAQAIQEGE